MDNWQNANYFRIFPDPFIIQRGHSSEGTVFVAHITCIACLHCVCLNNTMNLESCKGALGFNDGRMAGEWDSIGVRIQMFGFINGMGMCLLPWSW
jgi:hypothetical protein